MPKRKQGPTPKRGTRRAALHRPQTITDDCVFVRGWFNSCDAEAPGRDHRLPEGEVGVAYMLMGYDPAADLIRFRSNASIGEYVDLHTQFHELSAAFLADYPGVTRITDVRISFGRPDLDDAIEALHWMNSDFEAEHGSPAWLTSPDNP